jgi:tRNA modification GTPase
MYSLDDTIVAISTPLGEGGIGIVRMTGPEAAPILLRLFLPSPRSSVSSIQSPASAGSTSPTQILQPRRLHYGHILEPETGDMVDEVLVAHMPAPGTYTRQDVVEINGHGGFVALQRIQALCLRQGARLAEPGEFTARAFLNGRLDLAQAEAVLDAVQAKTEVSLQAAVGQLAGQLSGQVRSVRAILVEVLAYLEASIDFVEDEIPVQDIGPALGEARASLSHLLADADRGIIYRQGIRTAIIGRPNVGKSSLLNRLLRTGRAIVTDIPGTTRDTLEETVNLEGIPVVLVDTAGITADTEDPIERLGVERSRVALTQADLALLVVDASQPLCSADEDIAALVGGKPALVALNKIDLLHTVGSPRPGPESGPDAAGQGSLPTQHPHCSILNAPCIPISARTGEGLQDLEATIVRIVLAGQVKASQAPLVTSPRHKQALSQALDHLNSALAGYNHGQLADMLAIDVTAAIHALGEITGQTASEDLLETIFGNFCIGK